MSLPKIWLHYLEKVFQWPRLYFAALNWVFTADFMEETIPALSKLCRANMDFLQISH